MFTHRAVALISLPWQGGAVADVYDIMQVLNFPASAGIFYCPDLTTCNVVFYDI